MKLSSRLTQNPHSTRSSYNSYWELFLTIMHRLIKFEAVGSPCRILLQKIPDNCQIWIDTCHKELRVGATNVAWRESALGILLAFLLGWHCQPEPEPFSLAGTSDTDRKITHVFIRLFTYCGAEWRIRLNEGDVSDWWFIEVTLWQRHIFLMPWVVSSFIGWVRSCWPRGAAQWHAQALRKNEHILCSDRRHPSSSGLAPVDSNYSLQGWHAMARTFISTGCSCFKPSA